MSLEDVLEEHRAKKGLAENERVPQLEECSIEPDMQPDRSAMIRNSIRTWWAPS